MWIQILFYEEPQQGFLEQPAQQIILEQTAQSFEQPSQQMYLEKSAQSFEPSAQLMFLDQTAQSFESPAQQMFLGQSAQNFESTAHQMFLGQSAQNFELPAQQMSPGQPEQCFEQQAIFPGPVLEDSDTVSQDVLEEDLAKYLEEFSNILDMEAETLQNEPLDLSCKGRKEITL
ncbi:hypothetical protein AVEN_140767-1 [Araneus ventricosus]|uniref:Uncharacterized protein n=1 Tax=Araneus ventricosus TaxID=182803 RepID=A0A4Y2F0V9_ARAVE|nr:hypothetical protein AVEN_140767-1 [Araneus ventricosus]